LDAVAVTVIDDRDPAPLHQPVLEERVGCAGATLLGL
jgi:hypothetical protein